MQGNGIRQIFLKPMTRVIRSTKQRVPVSPQNGLRFNKNFKNPHSFHLQSEINQIIFVFHRFISFLLDVITGTDILFITLKCLLKLFLMESYEKDT